MVFYGGLGFFGFVLSGRISGIAIKSDIFSLLGILAIFLCLAFAFWSLQVLNDFHDIRTDIVARGRNPLLKGIGRGYYFASGMCIAFFSLAIALVLNYTAFLIILTLFLMGVVYSVPPLRLKRVPVLATFMLAVAVVLSMGLGFSAHFGEKAVLAIPAKILVPTLIGITLGFVSKDINDIEGDRLDGVLTIPIVLNGAKSTAGKIIMAIIMGMSFIVYAIFIPGVLPGAAAAFVATFLYTVLVKELREWFYFIVLYGFSAYLFFLLLA
jgi:4-hydroxybenzoate polyprenyltransferase